MATVDGITVEKAQEIEDASVVTGAINVGTGHLILTTAGGTVIDAGVARDDTAIAAAVLVETNNRITDVNNEESARIADVNAEESARIAADNALTSSITAITKPTPLNLYDGTNFSPTNTTASATSGGATRVEGTIVVPPTGLLKVTVQGLLRASSGGSPANGVWIGWQHRRDNVSGTIINDYNDARAILNENVNGIVTSMSVIVSDTPGATAYFRLMHIVNAGVTGGIRSRRLIVEGA